MCQREYHGSKNTCNIFKIYQYTLNRGDKMDKIFDKVDTRVIEKFEKSISEVLSIYLINSANKQGLLDDRMKDYIIHNI